MLEKCALLYTSLKFIQAWFEMVYTDKVTCGACRPKKTGRFSFCLRSPTLRGAHLWKKTSNSCVFPGCGFFMINTKSRSRPRLLRKDRPFEYPRARSPPGKFWLKGKSWQGTNSGKWKFPYAWYGFLRNMNSTCAWRTTFTFWKQENVSPMTA